MPTPEEATNDLLRSLGATGEQVAAYGSGQGLPALAIDLVLARGHTLTPEAVAQQAGCDSSDVVEVFRLIGVPVRPGEAVLGGDDVAMVRAILAPEVSTAHLVGGEEVLRVMAVSIARIADAAVALYVQQIESAPATREAADPAAVLEQVEVARETTQVALSVGAGLGTVFSHHLRQAIRRQRTSQEGIVERTVGRFAVGFVDLVGFTPLSRSLSPRGLVGLLTRFEALAFDIAATHDGRVVKHIGDEIMFTALDPNAGARVALGLVAGFADEVQPRGGLAFGDVVTLHGDHYGPVVNLASRLTDAAVPGEILVDAPTKQALDEVEAEAGGRRLLKGFDEAMAVFSLVP